MKIRWDYIYRCYLSTLSQLFFMPGPLEGIYDAVPGTREGDELEVLYV